MANFPRCATAILGLLCAAAVSPLTLRGEEDIGTDGAVGAEANVEIVGSDMAEGGPGSGGEGRQRPLTGEGCDLEATISDGKRGADGVHEARVTFRNKGDEPIGEVLLLIKAEPMSYWGNDRGGLAVFPEGKVDLYFAGAEGEPFLRAGQTKTIPVYHDGGGEFAVEEAVCDSEDIFRRMVMRIEVPDRFGKYAPYAESSLRSLYLSEAGWADILATSGARDSGEIGRRYFFSSVADSSLSAIAVGVGMMAAGGESAPEDQRGYVAETSFNEARAAFEDGRLDEAIELLRRVLILEPENAMALNNLAYIMLRRGDDAGDARPFIEQAMKIDPSQPGFQNTMSMVRWKEGKKDEAIELARRAYLGSGGEILETKLNLVEWGGEVPELGGAVGLEKVEPGADGGGGGDSPAAGVSTSDTIP